MAYLQCPNGRRQPLVQPETSVGRDSSNDLALPGDKLVSRRHAQLWLREDQWLLTDLDSRNGTFVADRRVRVHPLVDGDRLRFGTSVFVFVAEHDPNATEVGAPGVDDRLDELTDREREVVRLVAEGLTDKAIGEQLFISPSTVRSHLDRIGDKTGLRRRSELTRLAVDLGLVD